MAELGAALDSSHELFLHPSDHPNCSLSSEPLVGTNFGQWKRSCEVSLVSKNKLGFVTGTCAKPVTGPLVSQWERCNAMVISWLLHSIKKDIATSVLSAQLQNKSGMSLSFVMGRAKGRKFFRYSERLTIWPKVVCLFQITFLNARFYGMNMTC